MTLSLEQARDLGAAVRSVPMELGVFERVNGHETKNAPGRGLTCHVFVNAWDPIKSSGLSSTSIRVTYVARVLLDMMHDPQDDIDPLVLSASLATAEGYTSGFTMSPTPGVRAVDIRGMEGVRMGAPFGYFDQDHFKFRAADVTIPILLNDVLTEAP